MFRLAAAVRLQGSLPRAPIFRNSWKQFSTSAFHISRTAELYNNVGSDGSKARAALVGHVTDRILAIGAERLSVSKRVLAGAVKEMPGRHREEYNTAIR